jgi:competence protein ComFC
MGHGADVLANSLKLLLGDLLDFIYPSRCGVCGRELSREDVIICAGCWQALSAIPPPVCQKCGLPTSPQDLLCSSCEVRDHFFSFARSYGPFDEIFQKIIHLFKYRGKLSLSKPLAALMGATVRGDARYSPMEALIPVPLHSAKRRARGYNQSELLARDLSRTIGPPLLERVLVRTLNTRSQSKLSLSGRMANVQDAFRVKAPRQIQDRQIVLVDDVLTTGATADACASVLLKAGAAQVSVITMARAVEPGTSREAKKG